MTANNSAARAAVREPLAASFEANRALIAALQPGDLDRSTANPKWSVRQLAAHIAEDGAAALYVGKRLARAKSVRAPDLLVNLTNWWQLRKHTKAGVPELVAVLDSKHRQLMDWVDTLPPEALDRRGTISQLGTLTLAEFLVKHGEHSRAHGAEILQALGRGRNTP